MYSNQIGEARAIACLGDTLESCHTYWRGTSKIPLGAGANGERFGDQRVLIKRRTEREQ
ncbi:hypothetical protein [Nocardia niigatensis]|uniref:hypothetical protein n=1 Tax=Nocardia niigatensis TaxID=209249 RepID=UPI0012F7043D|nr:hypothetical protein [Nocardia niigatensis]